MNGCSICDELDGVTVDYDEGGQIRGLLCPSCKAGLALLRDDVSLINAAIEYLIERDGGVRCDHHAGAEDPPDCLACESLAAEYAQLGIGGDRG